MPTDSDEGIAFREDGCPEDDPIHPRSFGKIAEKIEKLITKYDFAFSRLQESVDECDKRQRDAVAARVKWERRRERYAQWANTQPRLKQAAGRPGPQYLCEACWPDICVWFPWKFWLRNCPRVDWPLPLKDGEMERCEKETILAAIYDFSMKGGRRIADGLNLEHYDKLTGINLPGSRYDGLVKQIPAKHLYHLERWLKQFEEDLQTTDHKKKSNASLAALGPDGASINWFGQSFIFTPQQRPVIGELWDAYKKGLRGLSARHLLSVADAKRKIRLPDIFKGSPAWNNLIKRVPGTNDLYHLAEPENQE